MIEILIKNVGGQLEERTVEGTVGEMQEIVEGYFEVIKLPRDIRLWVNEEGLIFSKPLNFAINNINNQTVMTIVGNAFFTGITKSGDIKSLTDLQKHWLKENMKEAGHAEEPKIGAYKLSVLKVVL